MYWKRPDTVSFPILLKSMFIIREQYWISNVSRFYTSINYDCFDLNQADGAEDDAMGI